MLVILISAISISTGSFVTISCTRCILFTRSFLGAKFVFVSFEYASFLESGNCSAKLASENMSLAELQALLRQSLILLAAARNLVTTGTKKRIAHRIFAHKHGCAHATRTIDPSLSQSQVDGVNLGSSSSPVIPALVTNRCRLCPLVI